MKNKFVLFGLAALVVVLLIFLATSLLKHGHKEKLNEDGIREDVAAEISTKFPNSEKKRAAAIQLSRAFQTAIDNPGEASAANELYERAASCLKAIEGVPVRGQPTGTSALIESWVVNSYERSQAYIRYNAGLSGRIFQSIDPEISKCEFDVAKMSN